MITATEGFLGYLCGKVDRMKPNECLRVYRYELREIPTFWHNDANFTAADRVLGNIVGSAYTHSYDVDPLSGDVTFRRHVNDGSIRHTDPDRRK